MKTCRMAISSVCSFQITIGEEFIFKIHAQICCHPHTFQKLLVKYCRPIRHSNPSISRNILKYCSTIDTYRHHTIKYIKSRFNDISHHFFELFTFFCFIITILISNIFTIYYKHTCSRSHTNTRAYTLTYTHLRLRYVM